MQPERRGAGHGRGATGALAEPPQPTPARAILRRLDRIRTRKWPAGQIAAARSTDDQTAESAQPPPHMCCGNAAAHAHVAPMTDEHPSRGFRN